MKIKKSKGDIIDSIYQANKEKLQLKQIKAVIDSFVETIADTLKDCTSVEIRGLGTFEITGVKARNVRNPRTDEITKVDSHCKVRFKPSRDLKATLKSINPKQIKK